MITKKELRRRRKKLLEDFPRDNLLISMAQSNNPQLYERLNKSLLSLVSAIDFVDEEMYNIAAAEYEICYQDFTSQNLNIEHNKKVQAQKAVDEIKERIRDKKDRIRKCNRKIGEFEKTINGITKKIERDKTNLIVDEANLEKLLNAEKR